MQQILPGSAVYHIAIAVRIRSAVDSALLRSALQTIADRHDSLRTVFTIDDKGELLKIFARSETSFEIIDTSGLGDSAIHAMVTEAYRRPFDLAAGPLFRSHLFSENPERHILLIAAHHLVFDALSLVLVMNELLELYSAARAGRVHTLLPVKSGYSDFVEWQRAMLAGPEGTAHLEFWRAQIEGAPQMLDLQTDRSRPEHPRAAAARSGFSSATILRSA